MEPLDYYQSEVQAGHIEHDAEQWRTVQHMQQLYRQLLEQNNRLQSGWLLRLFRQNRATLKGLYLWGGTGRGKTFLMDCFYACLPFTEKYRVHFHRFMLDIHQQLKELPRSPNPLGVIARTLSEKYRVLCLDEFHVHDIADAMLMAGLLKALFDKGVTLVVTSNIAIDDLYLNGLQRERFRYAIELLHKHTIEMNLGEGRDYRFNNLEKNKSYIVTQAGTGHEQLENYFNQLAVVTPKHQRSLVINNRPIAYRALADDLAWFDFRELCATYRSANDYIEIANICHTVFVSDVHCMSEANDDVAKRFIHLVDALYDHNVKLVVSAEAMPAQLYSGKRLALAFQRTISRLTEMSSQRYLSLSHK